MVSVKRNSKIYLPNGQLKLEADDLVTIIGKISDVTKIFGELNDEGSTKIVQLLKTTKAEAEANRKRIENLEFGEN